MMDERNEMINQYEWYDRWGNEMIDEWLKWSMNEWYDRWMIELVDEWTKW